MPNTKFSFGKRNRFSKPRGRCSTGRPTALDDPPLCVADSSPPRPTASVSSTADSAAGALTSEISSASVSDVATTLTAFERKVALLQQCGDTSKTTTNGASDDAEQLSGYRFVCVLVTKNLIASLLCPECRKLSLELKETGSGANLQFVVVCDRRGDVAKAVYSPIMKLSRQPKLSVRLAVVSCSCGINFTKLSNFFGGMNAPQPMHLKSFQ